MMMMPGRAAAVRRLAVVGADGVKLASLGHQLQSPIDRGQAYAFAVMS
jgi:predicted ATPase